MHASLVPLAEALRNLEKGVKASTGEEARSLMEMNGWNYPAVNKVDLCLMVREVRSLLDERADDDEPPPEFGAAALTARVSAIQATTVPYLFNGHGNDSVPVFINSLTALKVWINRWFPENQTVEPNTLPYKIARRAKQLTARLDSASEQTEKLDERLKLINDAHQAAESLPDDLVELKEIRATLVTMNGQAAVDAAAVKELRESAEGMLQSIEEFNKVAAGLVANCEEAYRITTSKGLAGAFETRAKSLESTMLWWVGGLVVSLFFVAWIGHNRVGALTAVLAGDPRWGTVTLNFLLSAISVGAPLWFAWVATKQIGQRFRLAEDYGFKASVAKAYEGYRKEAVNIDPKFAAQLFDIALTRLQEAPLRMVETESHGSPWSEFLRRPAKETGQTSAQTAAPATTRPAPVAANSEAKDED